MSYGLVRLLAILLWTMALLVASFPTIFIQHDSLHRRPVIFRRVPHVMKAIVETSIVSLPVAVRKRSQPTDTEYTDEFSVDPFMIYS
ncbi:hypothetical protein L596_002298 [Steinernema carpocapsae]|uniref:Uncharacterized protein n=1 Tax=Steinernema carpocapsae TaxID=34508 RepID=A0A4U8UP69_STECR|nr:hypothetical protein L596_002298 [Steinernema carpocapsae]